MPIGSRIGMAKPNAFSQSSRPANRCIASVAALHSSKRPTREHWSRCSDDCNSQRAMRRRKVSIHRTSINSVWNSERAWGIDGTSANLMLADVLAQEVSDQGHSLVIKELLAAVLGSVDDFKLTR